MSGRSAFYFDIIALAACSLPYRRTISVTTIFVVIKELLTWLMSSTAKASSSIPHTESTQLNSRTQGQMLHTTEQKLYRFYSPYNVELEQILGRPTNWEKQYND